MAKKRANGEGSIRKRKDGRWEGRYTAGYDEKTGKRIIKSVLGKTQAEVKESWQKRLLKRKRLTLSELTSTRLEHGCKRGMSYTQNRICGSQLPSITGAALNYILSHASEMFH